MAVTVNKKIEIASSNKSHKRREYLTNKDVTQVDN